MVLITYNDADELPTALRSVRRQTCRDLEILVVDDASTDDTQAVIAAVAAEDERIRPIRLPHNSGGCSRPRNTALDAATGEFVFFVDSDDVVPRRAIESLLTAARAAGADVTCGRMVRRHLHPRRHLPSNDELYLRAQVLDGVLDRPAQLRDTPACGKLFRRSFLEDNQLRFPEGLLFEDLLFTTTAYAAARRIAIVPRLSYVWNVRRHQANPSITNRRELRNWHDRFEVHRRIDRDLATRPRSDELAAAKDTKFLTVDWPLFLRELRAFPAAQRPELLALATSYLQGAAPETDGTAAPGLRAACFLARAGDLAETLTVADYVTTGGMGVDPVVEGDRAWWRSVHLDEPGGRDALDITATGVTQTGFAATPFLAVATAVTLRSGRLTIRGDVPDLRDRLNRGEVTAGLRVRSRLGATVLDVPATAALREGRLEFEATVDLAALGRRLQPAVGHELRFALVLHSRGEVAVVSMSARDAELPTEPVPVASRWSAVLGSTATLVERNGRLALELVHLHPAVDRVLDLATVTRGAVHRGRARLRTSLRS